MYFLFSGFFFLLLSFAASCFCNLSSNLCSYFFLKSIAAPPQIHEPSELGVHRQVASTSYSHRVYFPVVWISGGHDYR